MFINDIAAHRVQDATTHCGGTGVLIVGSPNVIIGNYGGGSGGWQTPPSPSDQRYEGGFEVFYEHTGRPAAGLRYRITTATGQVYEGVTNAHGRTISIDSDKDEDIELEVYYDEDELV